MLLIIESVLKFLIITRTDWNEPPRARHFLSEALSLNHTVIFVAVNAVGRPSISLSHPKKNITLIVPSWWLPGKFISRLPIINFFYQNWLYKFLKSKYKDYIVVNTDHSASLLNRYFKQSIYYCNDNFLDRKRSKSYFVSLYWFFTQKKIIANSLFCVGVSDYLYKYLVKFNKQSYLLLAGSPPLSKSLINYKRVDIQKINIVYVGWLNKINLDWLLPIIEIPNYDIYLIGPEKNIDLNAISNKKNIFVLGKMIGNELENIIKNADVCIAPYWIGKDTKEVYSMPSKFWLYLSYGKPIVTCRINNLISLPNKFIYQSNNAIEFKYNINLAITENNIGLHDKRVQVMKENSWESRAESLINLHKKHDNLIKGDI